MNKSELIDAMAESAEISKAAAGRALDGLLDTITAALKAGESVSLVGFGTFVVKDRAARVGRNPQTGASLEIAASKIPGFKASKVLKDSVAPPKAKAIPAAAKTVAVKTGKVVKNPVE